MVLTVSRNLYCKLDKIFELCWSLNNLSSYDEYWKLIPQIDYVLGIPRHYILKFVMLNM